MRGSVGKSVRPLCAAVSCVGIIIIATLAPGKMFLFQPSAALKEDLEKTSKKAKAELESLEVCSGGYGSGWLVMSRTLYVRVCDVAFQGVCGEAVPGRREGLYDTDDGPVGRHVSAAGCDCVN